MIRFYKYSTGYLLITMLFVFGWQSLLAQYVPTKDTVLLEGFISENKTLAPGKIYLIKHNVKVGKDAILSIESNTTVLFDENTSLVVEGGLNLNGAPNGLIHFTSLQSEKQGIGILVRGNQGGDINIRYTKFYKLKVPLKFDLEWYRKSVAVENNIFTELFTGESNILITSPFVSNDEDNESKIDFSFSTNSFVKNWGSIFIENFQDNVLDLKFTNNLITNNVVYGIDIGIPSNTPVFGLYDDVESKYKADISGNSIFGNYQINSSTDTIIREISFGIQGDGEVFNIPNNFFRSTDLNYISSTFDHFYQNSDLPLLKADPVLTVPREAAHPHIYKVKINGQEITNYASLPEVARRDASFEVYFNKPISLAGTDQLESVVYDTLTNELLRNPINVYDTKLSADRKMYSFKVSNASFLGNKMGYVILSKFKDNQGFFVPEFAIGQQTAINNYRRLDVTSIKTADIMQGGVSGVYLKESGYLPDQKSVEALKALTDFGDISYLEPYRSLAKTWEVGGMVGASNYFGTIPYKLIDRQETHFAFGIFGQYNASKWYSIRAMFWYGKISGNDLNAKNVDRQKRMLNFKNDILEGSLTFHWHLLKYGTSRGEKFSPTIFAGVALFRNKPMARIYLRNNANGDPIYLTYQNGQFLTDGSGEDVWVSLRDIGTEGQLVGGKDPESDPLRNSPYADLFADRTAPKQYKKLQVAFPIGISLDYILFNKWTISAELGIRVTTTRYLDDAGKYYFDRGSDYKLDVNGNRYNLQTDAYGLPVGYHQSIIDKAGTIEGRAGRENITLDPTVAVPLLDQNGDVVDEVEIATAALLANPSLVHNVQQEYLETGKGLQDGNNYAFSFEDAKKGGFGRDHYVFVGFKLTKVIDKREKKSYKEISTYTKEIKVKDSDNDGLSNDYEKELGTDPKNSDSDADGLKDGQEVNDIGSNPLDKDTDGDGLEDGREVNETKTSPLNADTDDDGLDDAKEVRETKTNPLNPDSDGGGITDGKEVNEDHTDPLNASDDKKDSDGDGVIDSQDDCPNKRGLAQFNGCPDSDGDGVPDMMDNCPETFGAASNKGCPEQTEKQEE